MLKYDSTGVLLWTKEAGSAGTDYGKSLTVHNSGNILVAGFAQGSVNGQPYVPCGNSGWDIIMLEYSSVGILLTTSMTGSNKDDVAYGVAVVNGGAVYIAGYTGGALNGQTNQGGLDIFLVQYIDVTPTGQPTLRPSVVPSCSPTLVPSVKPTFVPSVKSSVEPSLHPSVQPVTTLFPTVQPSISFPPTVVPTVVPSLRASISFNPTGPPNITEGSSDSKLRLFLNFGTVMFQLLIGNAVLIIVMTLIMFMIRRQRTAYIDLLVSLPLWQFISAVVAAMSTFLNLFAAASLLTKGHILSGVVIMLSYFLQACLTFFIIIRTFSSRSDINLSSSILPKVLSEESVMCAVLCFLSLQDTSILRFLPWGAN